MSEERIIRINKVLRELNISLERAVDYLKDKGIAIESNPNTKISEDVYNVLCGQFAGDKGNKEASKEVGEEKRKEKFNGAPGRIRTSDLQVRSLLLYPAGLLAHNREVVSTYKRPWRQVIF